MSVLCQDSPQILRRSSDRYITPSSRGVTRSFIPNDGTHEPGPLLDSSVSPPFHSTSQEHLMETFLENAFHLALPMSADELWSIVRVPPPGASPLRAAALAYSCHLSDHPNARIWREAAMANASATLMSAPSPSNWSWNNAPPPRDRILASALLARTAVLAGTASEARRWIVAAIRSLAALSGQGASSPGSLSAQAYQELWRHIRMTDCDIAIQTNMPPVLSVQDDARDYDYASPEWTPSRDGDELRYQATLLLGRVFLFRARLRCRTLRVDSAEFGSEFRATSSVITAFRANLPPLDSAFSSPAPLAHAFSDDVDARSPLLSRSYPGNAAIHTLSFVHVYAAAGAILLHDVVRERAASHREFMHRAAKDIAKVISISEAVDDAVLSISFVRILPVAIRVLSDDLEAEATAQWTDLISLSHIDVLRKRLASLRTRHPNLEAYDSPQSTRLFS